MGTPGTVEVTVAIGPVTVLVEVLVVVVNEVVVAMPVETTVEYR